MVAAVVASLLVAPGVRAEPAPAARSARGGISIVAPASGMSVPRRDVAAARAARVPLLAVFARGVTVTSTRLNGSPVRGLRVSGDRLVGVLDAADGLRPGLNTLRIDGTKPGVPPAVNAVSSFVVTYPGGGLIDLTVPPSAPGTVPAPRLRLPQSGLHSVSIWINGRDVTAALIPRRWQSGNGTVGLSAADFLHSGRNTVKLTVVMTDGRAQTLTRSFTLDRRRAIPGVQAVGASRDGAHVGQRVVLDAASSRFPASRYGSRAVSWRLVRRPARSHAVLGGGSGTRIGFVPDVPGIYRVQVTVGSGAQAGSTTLGVAATYADPLVPLNSMDTSSNPPAVVVGDQRYAPSGDIKVVVLQRLTLEPDTQVTYQQGFGTSSSELTRLSTFLKTLPSTDLVFVTHPSTSPVINPSDLNTLNTALSYLGGGWPGYWQFTNNACWSGEVHNCYNNNLPPTVSGGWVRLSGAAPIGSFSFAGVPGMTVGQAWRSTAVQSRSSEGRITGYLTQATSADPLSPFDYTIVAGRDQYVQVDTCASGGPTACVIKVGGQSFAPAAGANGMNLVILDRTTLTPISHQTVTSIDQLVVAFQQNNVATSTHVGRTVVYSYSDDDQDIVLLQSVGTGKLAPSSSNILPFIDHYGGTPELFLDAFTNGTPYALVGVANNLPWHGTAAESSAKIALQPGVTQSGRLRTVLSRGRDWLLTPRTGDPFSTRDSSNSTPTLANLDLFSIVYQDKTPWKYVGDPAIAYITHQLGFQDDDIRTKYVDNTYDGDWLSFADRESKFTCTSGVDICGTQFSDVQQQLYNEFNWVDSVQHIIADLQQPFNKSNSQYVDVTSTYQKILNSLKPPSTTTSFDWVYVFTEVTSIAGAIAFAAGLGEFGTALGLMSAIGEFVQDVTPSSANGDSLGVLRGDVNQLDTQISQQDQAYDDVILRLEDILLADPGKMATIYDKTHQKNAANYGWTWDNTTTIAAVQALNANAVSQSYSAILPAAWGMYALMPDFPDNMPADNLANYRCSGLGQGEGPALWAGAPPGNQLLAPTYVNTTNLTYVVDNWTYASIKVNNFYNDPAGSTRVPTTDFSNPLFATTTNGGFQYPAQWIRTTYNPPGSVACTPLAQFSGVSIAWNPPTLPNAQAAATT